VAETIEIPAGSGPVTKTISIPGASLGGDYYYRVIENGRLVKGLSVANWIPSGSGPYRGAESVPRLLIVSPANTTVDTTPITSAVGGPQPAAGRQPAGLLVLIQQPFPTAIVSTGSELTGRWIDYTSFDMILISLDDLTGLKRQQPETFQAMVDWAAAGGNLVVWGIGGNRNRLGELDSLLGLAGRPGPAEKPRGRGWFEPDKSAGGTPLREMQEALSAIQSFRSPGMPFMPAPPQALVVKKEESAAPQLERPTLLIREFQMGLLVAMAAENPFAAGNADWAGVFTAIGTDRLLWSQRHGISTVRDNPDFWNLLIPGVGLVPAMTFQVLITLFVLGIGPANYLLLRRWKRLHLLVVTVPLSATVVIAALFGYALAADGLGIRVRARTLTQIDQARGEAVCWSRLSYYCGLAPWGGLRFPADVAANPLEAAPAESATSAREVIWRDDQWLWRGWLSSRVPMQLLTVRSRQTTAGLDVRAAPEAAVSGEGQGRTWSVQNRLGTRITYLAVRTEDGQYHHLADALEPGQSAPLRPIDPASAASTLARLGQAHAPAFPRGMDPGAMRNYYNSRISYRRMRAMGFNSPYFSQRTTEQRSSRMEQELARLLGQAPTGNAPAGLGPRSYVAIVDRSPEVVLGLDRAREEGSFHVIHGTW
jgi:hypothetical protein